MGRPKKSDGEQWSVRSVRLSGAEIAFLEGRGGVSKAIHDWIASMLGGASFAPSLAAGMAPSTARPSPPKVSPWTGKPFCEDCVRKGPNIKCPRCGANAWGTS